MGLRRRGVKPGDPSGASRIRRPDLRPEAARRRMVGVAREPCQTAIRGWRAGRKDRDGGPATGSSAPAGRQIGLRLDEQDEGGAAEPGQERELGARRRPERVRSGPGRGRSRRSSAAAGLGEAEEDLEERDCDIARQTARRPWRARIRVTSSAYSRSPPTGSPRAIRLTTPTRVLEPLGEVHRGGLALERRVGREDDLDQRLARPLRLVRPGEELADLEAVRPDPVDRRDRAVEDVVEALELGRPLEGEDVERLLDDAQPR